MEKKELFGFQSTEMQNTVMEGMWGSVNFLCSCCSVSIAATFPVDGLGFGHDIDPFNCHILHSMRRYGHMGNLTAKD